MPDEPPLRSRPGSSVVTQGLGFLDELAAQPFVDGATRARAQKVAAEVRSAQEDRRLRLAVVGETSAGKSTFINALLGFDLLHSDLEPTTSVPTRLTWGPAFQVEIRTSGGVHRLWPEYQPSPEDIASASAILRQKAAGLLASDGMPAAEARSTIVEFIRRNTTEGGGATSVEEVVIRVPSPYLAAAVDIIDTPGTNPGLDAAGQARHAAMTRQCVESSHLAIFLIDSKNPLKATEQRFLREIAPVLSRIFFVANKMDLQDDEEAEEIEEYIPSTLTKMLGAAPATYFVASVPPKSRQSNKYWDQLGALRNDIIAFMQVQREAIALERISRLLAVSAEEMSAHGDAQRASFEDRLSQLNALQITDPDAMQREVLAIAEPVYLNELSRNHRAYERAVAQARKRTVSAFTAQIRAVQDKEQVGSKVESIAPLIVQQNLLGPVRAELVRIVGAAVESAFQVMNERFASMYQRAALSAPAPIDRNELIRMAASVVDHSLDPSSASSGVRGAQRVGNAAKVVGGVAGIAIGAAVFGAFNPALGRMAGMALGALFGPSIEKLHAKAIDGFTEYVDSVMNEIAPVAHGCLAGVHPEIGEFVNRHVAGRVHDLRTAVVRLQREHAEMTERVGLLVQHTGAAAVRSRALAASARDEAQALRDQIERQSLGGHADLTPVVDAATARAMVASVFGASVQGAADVAARVESMLDGHGVILDGDVGPALQTELEAARCASGLATSLAGGYAEAVRWWAACPQAAVVLKLSEVHREVFGLAPTSGSVRSFVAMAAVTPRDTPSLASRWRASHRRTGTMGSRADASTTGVFREAARSLDVAYRAWGLAPPADLYAGAAQLGVEVERIDRRQWNLKAAAVSALALSGAVAVIAAALSSGSATSAGVLPIADSGGAPVGTTEALAEAVEQEAAHRASEDCDGGCVSLAPPTPTPTPPPPPIAEPTAIPVPVASDSLQGAIPPAPPPLPPPADPLPASPVRAVDPSAPSSCRIVREATFRLRRTQTAAALGPEYPPGTEVEVGEIGSLRHGSAQMFHVTVPFDGAEGYVFLTVPELSPCGIGIGAPTRPRVGLPVSPTNVRASTFVSAGDRRYPPQFAFDGDPSTAWNEAGHGPGMGEWIEASFDTPTEFRRITLTTGWDRISGHGEDLFTGNSHLRRVSLQVDGRTVSTMDVAADDREVTFERLHAVGSTVRLFADAVWPGTHWSDLCIAEIVIEGTPRPAAAPSVQRPTSDGATGSRDEGVGRGGCVYQTHSAFHLRPTETVTRLGSQLITTNPPVRVVRPGATLRGSEGIFYVRFLDGSARGGWIFIPLEELGPGCPQF